MKNKKTINRLFGIILFILFLGSLVPLQPVYADGVMFRPPVSKTVWDQTTGTYVQEASSNIGSLVNEKSQFAMIKWDEGKKTENLMIVVDKEFYQSSNSEFALNTNTPTFGNPLVPRITVAPTPPATYWIVPIKTDNCDTVKIRHYDTFSTNLSYNPINTETKNNIELVKQIFLGSQIWPLLGKIVRYQEYRPQPQYYGDVNGVGIDMMPESSRGVGADYTPPPITVYSQIESKGVKSEIIYARSSDKLKEFLAQDNMVLNDTVQKKVDNYIGGDYCFAVSKLVDSDMQGGSKVGIMLQFNTDKPFYPMYITSAYGDLSIPLEIMINGIYHAKMGKETIPFDQIVLKNDITYGMEGEKMYQSGDILSRLQTSIQASSITADYSFESSWWDNMVVFYKLYSWVLVILLGIILSCLLAIYLFKGRYWLIGFANIAGLPGMILSYLVVWWYTDKKKRKEFTTEGGENYNSEDTRQLLLFRGNVMLNRFLYILFPVIYFILILFPHNGYYGYGDYYGYANESTMLPLIFLMIFLAFFAEMASHIAKSDVSKNIKTLFSDFVLGFSYVVLFFVFGLIVFSIIQSTGANQMALWVLGGIVLIDTMYFGYMRQDFRRAQHFLFWLGSGMVVLFLLLSIYTRMQFISYAILFSVATFYPLWLFHCRTHEKVIQDINRVLTPAEGQEQENRKTVPIRHFFPKLALYSVSFTLVYYAILFLVGSVF